VSPYSWSPNPDALVIVPALAAGYAVAVRLFPTRPWRVACFAGALVLLLAVYVTPLNGLALHYLLSAHLLQNVVAAEWAPALAVLGIPPRLADRALAVPAVRALTNPAIALPLWLAVYFLWHVPWIYDTALRHPNTLLHLEHASYFAAGAAFWWPVIHGRLSSGLKAAYLFAAFVLVSPLGLILALLPAPVYDFYAEAPRLWGLSRLSDQQLGGVTMAAEQAVVFFVACALYFARFLREEDARDVYRRPRRASTP
jgi:cytochrome c oxidase assembly factor CtaG